MRNLRCDSIFIHLATCQIARGPVRCDAAQSVRRVSQRFVNHTVIHSIVQSGVLENATVDEAAFYELRDSTDSFLRRHREDANSKEACEGRGAAASATADPKNAPDTTAPQPSGQVIPFECQIDEAVTSGSEPCDQRGGAVSAGGSHGTGSGAPGGMQLNDVASDTQSRPSSLHADNSSISIAADDAVSLRPWQQHLESGATHSESSAVQRPIGNPSDDDRDVAEVPDELQAPVLEAQRAEMHDLTRTLLDVVFAEQGSSATDVDISVAMDRYLGMAQAVQPPLVGEKLAVHALRLAVEDRITSRACAPSAAVFLNLLGCTQHVIGMTFAGSKTQYAPN